VPGTAVIAVLVVVVAFALISCSGSTGGGTRTRGTSPGMAQSSAQWQALTAQNYAVGTWGNGNSLVVAVNTQVTAYSRVTGKVLWRTKAPVADGHNTMFCGASQSISGSTVMLGIGVATDSTGDDSDCHSVISLNVATGRLGWLQGLPSPAESLASARSLDGHLAAAPLTVVVGQVTPIDAANVVSFSSDLTATRILRGGPQLVSDGAVIGKTLSASAINGNVDAHQFYPFTLSNGLLVAATLAPEGGGQGNKLVTFDYATGATKWTAAVPRLLPLCHGGWPRLRGRLVAVQDRPGLPAGGIQPELTRTEGNVIEVLIRTGVERTPPGLPGPGRREVWCHAPATAPRPCRAIPQI
jgi:hypothetical protein